MQECSIRKQEILESSKLYELLPKAPNELWQMDVTYIYINGYGWFYAVTVIDYFSRYLLACHFCRSYSSDEVIKGLQCALAEAVRIHGKLKKPPFLVTDNGSSFISLKFRAAIKDCFSHVRIQYRTPQQLGLLERFHETLKNEEVYYEPCDSPFEAKDRLEKNRVLYNNVRPHWALKPESGRDVLTPREVYCNGTAIRIPRWQGWAKGAKEKLDKMIEEMVA